MPKPKSYRPSVLSQPAAWLLAAAAAAFAYLFAVMHPRQSAGQTGNAPTADIRVFFSPHGGCTRELVSLINRAGKSVDVEAYSFTSRPIVKALIAAHQRGVRVVVILDRSNLLKKNYRTHKYTRHPSPALQACYAAGIPVYIDARYLIAHNKVMLIDGNTIVTGSFNFSYAAAHFNAENMLVVHHAPAIFAAYLKNFLHHEATSQRYSPGLVLRHIFKFPNRRWTGG
jgi:phosphatidylserine/phosphatidylglycerophosphate/cardiolipin synthase-like enzyme